MTNHETITLGELMQKFTEECPVPTPENVSDWQKRYPDHSDYIGTLASIMTQPSVDEDEDFEKYARLFVCSLATKIETMNSRKDLESYSDSQRDFAKSLLVSGTECIFERTARELFAKAPSVLENIKIKVALSHKEI